MIDKRSTKAYKLEKENKRLKEEIEVLRSGNDITKIINDNQVFLKYQQDNDKEIERLNNIINKATEEIKRVLDIWENKPNEIATLDLEYLLNILQGSDK